MTRQADNHWCRAENKPCCPPKSRYCYIVDSGEVAEIFNAYFSNIASEIGFQDQHSTAEEAISAHENHPSVIKIRDTYGDKAHSFNFEVVDLTCIAKKLKMINIRKATGYDNIPAKLLRLAHNELTYSITNLVNNSMASVQSWVPYIKKEDNLNKKNFRPVSILTGISKLYESVVNDQLLEFFSRLFNDLIGAYRKGYSCQSLLVKCIDNSKNALDKQMFIGTLFMDLSKAFDCLPHSLIIAKLRAYGLELPACKLLFSYLRGRKQRVKISNSRRSWTVLTKGVPQGSILGPLLFNNFMNDLFLFIEKCQLYNYADDNSLDSSSENLIEVLSNLRCDGRKAIEWFANNGMQANPDKFHFMLFSPKPTTQQVLRIRDDTSLMSEAEVKVLGVTIDDKLSFSQHISACCKKAARQLNALARISKHSNINSRRAIYNSFITSNFNYCPLVWHFCGQVNNQKLENIQERALRILFADYNSSYIELLGKAGTTTLLIQRLRLIALTVFKSLHGLNPPCLNDMFTHKSVPYEMRDSSLLEQSRCRTTQFGLRSISYIGVKLWNDLPNDFKEATDFTDFKMILQTWTGPDLDGPFRSYIWAISDTLYTNQIFYQEFYLFHISSHAFIPLLTCSLLQCCLELAVLWVSVTACNSTVRLAHSKPVLCGWTRLVVPVGFGCPGGLPGVLRLHVPRVRVVREHAHRSLAM